MTPSGSSPPRPVSPRARRVAAALQVDLQRLAGDGRIEEREVFAAADVSLQLGTSPVAVLQASLSATPLRRLLDQARDAGRRNETAPAVSAALCQAALAARVLDSSLRRWENTPLSLALPAPRRLTLVSLSMAQVEAGIRPLSQDIEICSVLAREGRLAGEASAPLAVLDLESVGLDFVQMPLPEGAVFLLQAAPLSGGDEAWRLTALADLQQLEFADAAGWLARARELLEAPEWMFHGVLDQR